MPASAEAGGGALGIADLYRGPYISRGGNHASQGQRCNEALLYVYSTVHEEILPTCGVHDGGEHEEELVVAGDDLLHVVADVAQEVRRRHLQQLLPAHCSVLLTAQERYNTI